MKNIVLAFSLFLFYLPLAFAQKVNYAHYFGAGSSSINGRAVAVAPDNSVYCFGEFFGTTDFDPSPAIQNLTPSNGGNLYISKYDSIGNLTWAKNYGTVQNAGNGITVTDAATDGLGNVYICGIGYFSGTSYDFDPNTGTAYATAYGSANTQDIFFAKYSPAGGLIWVKSIGSANGDDVISISVTKQGTFFLTGVFTTSIDLDPSANTINKGSVTGANLFFAKYDSTGNYLWGQVLESNVSETVGTITHDKAGNLYVEGSTFGTLDIDPSINGTYNITKRFIAKYNSNGNFIWGKQIEGQYGNIPNASISVDKHKNVYVTGAVYGTVDLDPNAGVVNYTSSGTDPYLLKLDSMGNTVYVNAVKGLIQNDYGLQVKTDTLGNLYWGGQIDAKMLDFDFDPNHVFALNGIPSSWQENFLVVYDAATMSFKWAIQPGNLMGSFDVSQNGFMGVTGTTAGIRDYDPSSMIKSISSPGGYVATFKNRPLNKISGKCFVDINANGTWNLFEPAVEQMVKSISAGSDSCISFSYNGYFSNILDIGTYTSSTANIPYFYCSPAQKTTNFTQYGQLDSVEFALTPIANIQDLRINLLPLTQLRVGDTAHYKISYKNQGTISCNGQIKMYLPDTMYQTATFSVAPTQIVGDTIYWNYSNLNVMETRTIDISCIVDIPPFVNLGDTFVLKSWINPTYSDTTAFDNYAQIQQIVISSYDPNYIEVFPPLYVYPAQFTEDDYITYVIHFQNTGTDTAFMIRIANPLNANLYGSSIEIIESSHTVELQAFSDGNLVWSFYNILLPDSNVNEAASHGYVMYKIKMKPNIPINTQIKNKASIYFDYNQPVATNEVISTVTTFPNITANPQNVSLICEGNEAFFRVTTALPSTYKWEKSNGAGGWITLSDGITYSGTSTDTLHIMNVIPSFANVPYKCEVTSAAGVITSQTAIILNVSPNPAPIITLAGNSLSSSYSNGNQWYVNNVAIPAPAGTAATYTPLVSGNYYVTHTNSSTGCISANSNIINFIMTNMQNANSPVELLSVYPNPIQDALYIKSKHKTSLNVLIFDGQGKKVMTFELAPFQSKELITTNLSKGVYYIHIENVANSQDISIIKQ